MSNTALKIWAVIFMTIDHIGLFIPNTPIYFRWIGRMAYPIFLFCIIEGIYHTSNIKKYFLRIYLFCTLTAILFCFLSFYYKTAIDCNAFTNFVPLILFIMILELKRKGNPRFKLYLGLFIVWQIVGAVLLYYIDSNSNPSLVLLIIGFMGNIFFSEGRFIYFILGLIFYFTHDNKKLFLKLFCLFGISIPLINILNIVPRLFNSECMNTIEIYLFYQLGIEPLNFYGMVPIWERCFNIFFQWMMLFSIPFILLYNGTRGKKLKYAFYLYYPIHISILVFISQTILTKI